MGTSFGFLPSGAQPDVRRVDGNARASATSVRVLPEDAVEHVARRLLRRYGVVYRRLIRIRSFAVAPGASCYGSIGPRRVVVKSGAGGFAAGFSGEQFAPPDAVGLLRETRRRGYIGNWIAVSGADPLNLAGVLTRGSKIAALAGNRVLYRDGVPVASLVAREVTFFEGVDSATQWQVRQALFAWRGVCSVVGAELDGDAARISSRTPSAQLA